VAFEALSAPPSSLPVSVPQYVVKNSYGQDYVEILGHAHLLEIGRPIVPLYTKTIDLPAGYSVQNVTITEKGGLSTDMLKLALYEDKEPGDVQTAEAAGPEGDGWWPEKEFDWTVIAGPNDTSTLIINIYPLYYNFATTQVKFYSTYNFDIDTTASPIWIDGLRTNKLIYEPNDTVHVEFYARNPSGQDADLVAEALIRSADSTVADGLQLRWLKSVGAIGSVGWQWDSTGFPAGAYDVEVTLRHPNGAILDRSTKSISIGSSDCAISYFSIVPQCFQTGANVTVKAGLYNTGDVSITGSLIISLQELDGAEIQQFTQDFNDLAPGAFVQLNSLWSPATRARGDCRFLCYALYNGLSTSALIWPEPAADPTGDFDASDTADFDDFVILAQYWLQNEPSVDIAPAGGDCVIDYLDVKVLAENWLIQHD
jgi:hypothetical protein